MHPAGVSWRPLLTELAASQLAQFSQLNHDTESRLSEIIHKTLCRCVIRAYIVPDRWWDVPGKPLFGCFLGVLAEMGQISSTHRMLQLKTWSLLLLVCLPVRGKSFTVLFIIMLVSLLIRPWETDLLVMWGWNGKDYDAHVVLSCNYLNWFRCSSVISSWKLSFVFVSGHVGLMYEVGYRLSFQYELSLGLFTGLQLLITWR